MSCEAREPFLEISPGASPANQLLLTGAAAFSQLQARTGSTAIRCNPASGAAASFDPALIGNWCHFGFYIATMPTVTRLIVGEPTFNGLRLTSAGLIEVWNGTAVTGTSTTALVTGRWYWIGFRNQNSISGVVSLQIDGVDESSGGLGAGGSQKYGPSGTEASAIDVYYDDFIRDNATFLAPSKVGMLQPVSDSAIGTGWTLGSGGTTNLWGGVDNAPPTGVADPGTLAQIRNATANANVNYDATMATYSSLGITASDTLLAVRGYVSTAAPVTTSSKLGTVGMASNPAITNVALQAPGTAGAFWQGAAGGTYPTGWKSSATTISLAPSVTLTSGPVMRVTQVTASTRIASVCAMAVAVAWTPAAVAPTALARPPYLVQQARNASANR